MRQGVARPFAGDVMTRTLATLVLGALLVAAPAAHATTVLELPLSQMARSSAMVVRARVLMQHTAWSDDGSRILTRTTLQVIDALKGPAMSHVVLQQVGGTLDGITVRIPGDAVLAPGEDVVVFLERHPDGSGDYVLAAMSFAKFRVVPTESGPVVVRDLSGLTLAGVDEDGVIRPRPGTAPESMPYEQLVEEVSGTVRLPPDVTPR